METVRIRDALTLYSKNRPRPQHYKKSESVDPCWGLDCVFLDDADIKALQKGRVLYFSDGEYAHLIVRCEK